MNTGRIENEPDSVYFGESDKPAFGSSAIKLWLEDQNLFYHQMVKKDVPERDWGQVGVVGHAVEELLLENKERIVRTEYAGSTGKAFKELVANHPDKLVLTTNDWEEVKNCVLAGTADPCLISLVNEGKAQVTYRTDMGPFYIQARIDLEVHAENVPERCCDPLRFDPLTKRALLVDTKTTATLYGQNGFERRFNSFKYPIQDALYRIVVADCIGCQPSQVAFRFCALAKDGTGCKWYESVDVDETATSLVMGAIGELNYRYQTNDWSDFEQPLTQIMVPENYLTWR